MHRVEPGAIRLEWMELLSRINQSPLINLWMMLETNVWQGILPWRPFSAIRQDPFRKCEYWVSCPFSGYSERTASILSSCPEDRRRYPFSLFKASAISFSSIVNLAFMVSSKIFFSCFSARNNRFRKLHFHLQHTEQDRHNNHCDDHIVDRVLGTRKNLMQIFRNIFLTMTSLFFSETVYKIVFSSNNMDNNHSEIVSLVLSLWWTCLLHRVI